ncbi:hypothetical protein RC74_15480 [Falsihalocynthiibacter arcticus]|uniref:Uncharacterized protein n=1 Tax=Falsihalocynthiibacter arcticus TaxID=1579316 RepID=A0A126V3G7_9RHOB|nr:hypothetical protein RC74_15480 [Falsihalocynthiibacter arcticus]
MPSVEQKSDKLYTGNEQITRSKTEPYFPFGIEKTCGNETPRLKLADVRGRPQQGDISLWETHSKDGNVDRFVVWNEITECGFLIEAVSSDDGKAKIGITPKDGGITVILQDMVVE